MAGGPSRTTVDVGGVRIRGRAALAPLAGYTEYPFRATVARFGCPYAVTPLISAESLVRGGEGSRRLLATGPDDASVVAAQLFGSRPAAMAEAARIAAAAGFALVDLNLGCPVPRVGRQQAGAALAADEKALRTVARAVVAASPVPVTAKMRLGRNAADRRGPATARMLAEEGVAALTVHGRTVDRGFTGPVDYEAIAEIAAAVAVPVWANGGVRTPRDAGDLLKRTEAAGVMVGRAAVRRPYLIRDVDVYLATGREPKPPTPAELAAAIEFHFERAAALDGEDRAARYFARHLLAYLKGAGGDKALRKRAAYARSRAEVFAVVEELREMPLNGT
jgi:nifR3 family TIM-barrel protein